MKTEIQFKDGTDGTAKWGMETLGLGFKNKGS